jgi:hypothetical protein
MLDISERRKEKRNTTHPANVDLYFNGHAGTSTTSILCVYLLLTLSTSNVTSTKSTNPSTNSGIIFHRHALIIVRLPDIYLRLLSLTNGKSKTAAYQFSGVHLWSGYLTGAGFASATARSMNWLPVLDVSTNV